MSRRRRSIRTFAIAVTALVLTATSGHTPKSWALLQDSPKELVDAAWQITYRQYVDRTFNRNDWIAVRQKYLQRSYSSQQQAYTAIRELLATLDDPYTEFLEPQEIKDLVSNTSGDFVGVGLTVALDVSTRAWIVVAPIKGSPAAAAGVLPKDVVLRINGKSTSEIGPEQATQYLVGPVGSQIFLTVQRGNRQLNFKLLRDHIDLNPVAYRITTTTAGKVGYIRLPVFTSQSPKQMRQAIATLEKQQVKGYILDLRSNPGGILESSVAIARLWLGKHPIVSIVNQQGNERLFANGLALTNRPLAVLIDDKSASASEILAGALQDSHRATLVGTRTFGKGLVQSLAPLKDGSGVKITVAKYYTPKGRDINKVGIAPDIMVQLPETQKAALLEGGGATSTDPQYSKALVHLSQLIRSKPVTSLR